MDITLDELKIIADEKGFDLILLEKDYLLTYLLYLIRDVKNLYFKGGTALNKILLNYERLSEDLDFTVTDKIDNIEKEIKTRLKGTLFHKISHDKRNDKFVRLIIHYKLFHEDGTIFLDLNQKAKPTLKPQKTEITHFYSEHIPKFKTNCLHKNEIVAEKIRAACQRNKPRDYFDIYHIIKNKIPISTNLVKRKCDENGTTFTPSLLFRKTSKIYNEWNQDLSGLTKTNLQFIEVIKTLKEFFNYKK